MEVLTKNFGYSFPVDIWSLGIIAIEIATGKTPFDEINSVEQMKQIINSNFLLHWTNDFSKEFIDFLSKCLEIKHDKRLSAAKLLNHNFIKKADDEKYIEKVLTSKFLPLIQRFKFINYNEFDEEKNHNIIKKYEFVFDEKEEDLVFTLDDFILQDLIGQGTFGKVYKVKSKKDGKIYAPKISRKSFANLDKDFINISREVNIMSKLNHPSVLKFIFYSPINFKGKSKPVLITEFASNHSLDQLIKNENKLKSNTILNDTRKIIIIYGIASAMSYLHTHHILHRDLKPSNILLDELLFPKIADFGYSKVNHLTNEMMTLKSTIGTPKGTPIYMAPEIWNKGEYSEASDVYAFGIVMYEIITNENPYENLHYFDLIFKTCEGYRPEFKNPISKPFKKLIESCWSQNPNDRPTFKNILEKLQNDEELISSSVDREAYYNYIKFIHGYDITFNSTKNIFYFNQRTKTYSMIELKNDEFLKLYNDFRSKFYGYPYKEFIKLNEKCKDLVRNSVNKSEKQFLIGKSLIEGINQFPFNVYLGIHFLKKSYNNGCNESIIYYCKMLIKGDFIFEDLNKVIKLLKDKINDEAIKSLLFGLIYKKGKNYKKAKQFFKNSLELGNHEAMYEYGKMLFKGIESQIDKENAIKYYLMSINFDNFKAMFKYGLLLKNGDDYIEKDIEKAVYYIKISAEKGYSKAMYYYSLMLETGDGIEIDKLNSLNYLKKAAKNGYVEAINKYTELIINDKDQKELNEILSLLKKACEKGNFYSMYLFSMLFFNGINVSISQEDAIKYIIIAAYNNQVDSMAYYGHILLNGNGVSVDKKKAIKFFKKAINKGNANAMYEYANMLFYGDNISTDKQKAIEYYKTAALKGNSNSVLKVLELINNRIHIDINKDEKIKLYKIAADAGDSESMIKYADFLNNGDEITMNKKEAIKYYNMAINKGSIEAMLKYGMILINGDGLPINIEKGIQYIKFAADNGFSNAKIILDEFQNSLFSKTIKENP